MMPANIGADGGPVTVTMVETYPFGAWLSKKDWYAEPLAS
jgi:hypothetical protein